MLLGRCFCCCWACRCLCRCCCWWLAVAVAVVAAAAVVDAKAVSSSRRNTATAAGAACRGLVLIFGVVVEKDTVSTVCRNRHNQINIEVVKSITLAELSPWDLGTDSGSDKSPTPTTSCQAKIYLLRFNHRSLETGVWSRDSCSLAAFPVLLSREERRAAPPIDAELETTEE